MFGMQTLCWLAVFYSVYLMKEGERERERERVDDLTIWPYHSAHTRKKDLRPISPDHWRKVQICRCILVDQGTLNVPGITQYHWVPDFPVLNRLSKITITKLMYWKTTKLSRYSEVYRVIPGRLLFSGLTPKMPFSFTNKTAPNFTGIRS